MFHYRDNLFFGRMSNGAVRMLKFASPPREFPQADRGYMTEAGDDGVVLDAVIDSNSWGSVVASVSAGGEENGRYYEIMDFHHGRRIQNPVSLAQQVILPCCKCGKPMDSQGHLDAAEVDGVVVTTRAYCSRCYEAMSKP